jgi:D-alanine transaminase
MARIAYVNGRYAPHRAAQIHVEDRGFLFADGVYEVIAIRRGKFVDEDRHLARLARSRNEIGLAAPMSDAALRGVIRETVRRNRVTDGIVYLQVTRGSAPRDFGFPKAASPSLVVIARAQTIASPRLIEDGIAVVTVPDLRWKRPDIKSVALLPNVLAKQKAKAANAYEAWQVDAEGNITEGTSSNAWIVTAANEIITRQADHSILNGVTRLGLLDIIARGDLRLVERPFSLGEARAAREAILTSSTNGVLPVVRIDGANIGDGRPGSLAVTLAAAYRRYMIDQPG